MLFLTMKAPSTNSFISWVIYLFHNYWPMYLDGMKYTLLIALISTIIGLVIAMFLTPFKILTVTSRDTLIMKIIKKLCVFFITFYVEVLRGTPMMVQAFIIYYGLIGLGLDLTISFDQTVVIPGIIVYGIVIVSINTSAYIIEVLRGSINAIDKGQMEAARSLGMTRSQAMRHVIIPQALKNSIPPIGNEFVINIKDTSVLSVIAVTELFFATRKVNGVYYQTIPSYAIAAILYLLMTFTTTRLLYLISNRLGNPKIKAVKENVTYPTSQSY